MITLRTALLMSSALLLAAAPACAQDSDGEEETTTAFGGQGGADMSIDAIEPSDEPVRVGSAGEDPADIARYLLASGAGGASLSPDGETLAFSWSITGEPQLWVMDAAGGQPRRLTFGSGITFYRWAPDGEGLVYGADNDGNEQPAFYQIALDGLSESVVLPAAEGGFRAFGDFIGEDAIVYSSTERNGLDFDVWRATLGGEAEIVFEGSFAYYARAVSPSGNLTIVTESVGEDSDNLYLLDMGDGTLATVSAPEPRANHSDAGFVWSGDEGFYFATNLDGEYAALSFYTLSSGETETLFAAEGADIASFELCGADDGILAYTVNRDGFHELVIRDLASGEALATPDLPEGTYGLSCADDAARLSVSVSGWATPGDIYVIDLDTGAATRAFASNLAGLDASRLIRPESVRMTARDGVELQGLLYIPDEASRGGQAAPVLFDVHGGPTGQSQASWNASIQYLLDRGIAVFEPNVRGSTGFGRTYVTLDDRENRLDSVRDLVDMRAALQADDRIDASRAAVRGGSYGGYMVNAVLAAFPGEFVAGVSLFGVADWVTALEVASPGLKAAARIQYGDITEQRWVDFYTEQSPIRQADQINVPVLYSHGVMDPRIDIYETEVMVTTLRENGVRADFIRMPDEGHGWRKLDNRLFYGRREAAFLEEMLMGAGE
jgi:dipeptidyl aminopeptidase/acylaminoacyl peptidase